MNADFLSLLFTILTTWKTYLVTLVAAALAAYVLTPLAGRLAVRWGALDLPGPRKVHTAPMPRLGGLAVFAGFCFPWTGFYLLDNRVTETFQDYEKLFLALTVGAGIMLLLGAYDDVKGTDPWKKLGVQLAVALGLYACGFRITSLSVPFGSAIELGWWALPASLLWVVGITNAINLLDGIDGLATGVTACIALALAIINMLGNNVMVALLTLCLAGACLGFLPHNFSPARIFLGDSGSLSIGMILACIGMMSLFKAATATVLAVPLVMFGLPVFDTASVVLGRAFRRVPIFQADKTHIHHRLLALGLNHKQAAYLLYFVTAACGGFAVVLSVHTSAAGSVASIGLGLVLAFIAVRAWQGRRRVKPPPPSPAGVGK